MDGGCRNAMQWLVLRRRQAAAGLSLPHCVTAQIPHVPNRDRKAKKANGRAAATAGRGGEPWELGGGEGEAAEGGGFLRQGNQDAVDLLRDGAPTRLAWDRSHMANFSKENRHNG